MNQKKKKDHQLKPAQVVKRAVDLITSQNTMTLATADGEFAWAAPVITPILQYSNTP